MIPKIVVLILIFGVILADMIGYYEPLDIATEELRLTHVLEEENCIIAQRELILNKVYWHMFSNMLPNILPQSIKFAILTFSFPV